MLSVSVLYACGPSSLEDSALSARSPSGAGAIDPSSEPSQPKEPPADGRAELDTEYFLGSEREELAQFAEFAKRIQALQKESSERRQQPISRGFHAKAHACLNGRLELEPHRDPRSRFGIFADGQPNRRVVVRFSNGVGWKQDDAELDARGMAVKVFDVPGPKYLPEEPTTQDFLMTNSPTPVGRDAVEFMEFARANVSGRAAEFLFLASHAKTGAPALSKTTPVDSMVTSQYWSGGAFHLGAHQAVKVTARPCDSRLERHPDRSSPDYLRADLLDAAKQGVCMRLFVQFQSDPVRTPVEDASREWREEDAPFVPVAKIHMPPQDPSADAGTTGTSACDALAFSPWHAIPAHKPMGHINRARKYVYHASQEARGAQPVK